MKRIAEIAWAAGLIEGEGTIAATDVGFKKRRVSAPRIAVGSTDIDVVARLLEYFGVGNIYGPRCYEKALGRKPQWFWKVYNKNAIAVGMTIWSYLGERRKAKVNEMIAIWKVARKGPRRPEGT